MTWKDFHKLLGLLLIITGVIFYPTPIPGTTFLIILGFIWMIGAHKTSRFLKNILGPKIFKSLKLDKLIQKLKGGN